MQEVQVIKTYKISELDDDHVEWLEWSGGSNPLSDDTYRVCCILDNGSLIINYPSLLDWSHGLNNDYNISVYVVLENAK